MNIKFWKNKKILIIGHTGFKGGWLTMVLNLLGAKVYGISLPPDTNNNFYNLTNLKNYLIEDKKLNIENFNLLKSKIIKIKPEIIFHLAAQSKVRDSYISPLNTIRTNTLGTANILEIFKQNKFIKTLLITTTDKVYKNTDNKKFFTENDELGGDDVYSASKSSVEIITNSYFKSFFSESKEKSVICLRAGNVIGGGDWSKDRIIPDCIKSIKNKKSIILRNPKSIRPWQHVLEPIMGYIITAEKIHKLKNNLGPAINFGPKRSNCVNVKMLASKLILNLNLKNKIIEKKSKQNFQEKKYLFLNSSNALKKINWKSILSFDQTIKLTADWYDMYFKKKNLENFTIFQIKNS